MGGKGTAALARGEMRCGARCDQMPMPGLGGRLCGAALLAAQPFWLRGCAVEAVEAWRGADGGVGGVRMEAWWGADGGVGAGRWAH